uniref:Uncharacterized protein n=1 Tax=Globodera pallida TaxID=36090 RepID=A0A183CB18_GLOPA
MELSEEMQLLRARISELERRQMPNSSTSSANRTEAELAKMTWKIKWEELDGEDCREKKKRQQNSSAAKLARSDAIEQSEALLRCNSRMSVGSDKMSCWTCLLWFNYRRGNAWMGGGRNISSTQSYAPPPHTNSTSVVMMNNNNNSKKKSSAEETTTAAASTTEDLELDTCNSAKKSLVSYSKNRKFSFSGFSIRSGGSVETIQMQKNQIFTQTAMYKGTMVAIKMLNLDLKKYPKLELP